MGDRGITNWQRHPHTRPHLLTERVRCSSDALAAHHCLPMPVAIMMFSDSVALALSRCPLGARPVTVFAGPGKVAIPSPTLTPVQTALPAGVRLLSLNSRTAAPGGDVILRLYNGMTQVPPSSQGVMQAA